MHIDCCCTKHLCFILVTRFICIMCVEDKQVKVFSFSFSVLFLSKIWLQCDSL